MRPLLLPAAAVAALVLLATPASAACVWRACASYADLDGDGTPDAAQATVLGNGGYVHATPSAGEADVFALGYGSYTDYAYEDPAAESTGKRATVESVTALPVGGAYGLLYVEDFDKGDVVDYAYGTVTVWTPAAIAGAGFLYQDDTQDGKPGVWGAGVN